MDENHFLSQKEIDTLLQAMEFKKDNAPINQSRRIKIYDFKRPSRFSKEEIREVSNVSETIARELTKFFACEYEMFPKFHVVTVDELTCEEFLRSLPILAPSFNFSWMNCEGIFEMDGQIFFKGFMGSNPKKNRDLNGLEQNVFTNYIYKPIEKIIHKEFSNVAHKELPEITEQEFNNNSSFLFKYNDPTQMGIVVTFELSIESAEGTMSLFLTQDLVEALKENNFFTCKRFYQKKNIIVIPLTHPEPNTIVEVGRFRLEDNFKLQKNMIFESNHLAGDPLKIYKNGTHIAFGEAVVIEDNFGVRITKMAETPEEESFYNTRIIYGGCTTTPDEKFGEGRILELIEWWNEPAKIIKDNKVIAYGEICVVGENYGVRIKKVVEE